VKGAALGLLALLAGGCREQARAAQVNAGAAVGGGGAGAAKAGGASAQNRGAAEAQGAGSQGGDAWSCGAVHGEARIVRRLGRDGRLRLGAIADLHGRADGAARAAGLFGRERVDGVLALGDLGDDEDGVTRVLLALRGAGAPILALAGETESEGAFHAAVRRARAGGVDVIDLVDVRVIDAGEALIVSAPGYRYSRRGCHYEARDLEGLRAFVGATKKPLVLAAHAPPRDDADGHDGANGIDRGFGDANVGDPAMRALVDGLGPAAALFAHVDEAGGRQHGRWLNVGQTVARVDVVDGQATMTVLAVAP
jgi:Icc-related predicted phosphoesterase